MSRADFIRFEPHLPPLLPPPGGHRSRCERALSSCPRARLISIGVDCLEHAIANATFQPQLRDVLASLRGGEPERARGVVEKLKQGNASLEHADAQRRLAAMHAVESLLLCGSSEKPLHDLSFALSMLVAASDLSLTELAWQSELVVTGTPVERRVVQVSDWSPIAAALSIDEFVSGAAQRKFVGPPVLRIARWLDATPRGCLMQFCQQLFATTARELAPLLEPSRAEELVRTLEVARTPDAAVRCLIERWLNGPEPLGSQRAHALRAVAEATRALVHPELASMHASDAIKSRSAAAKNHVGSWVDSLNLLLTCTNVPPW
ncbi:MAG: hypothetical protein QM817_33380 [Archangium sp.]